MFAGQGGLGLPDEEYYRLDEYADIRAQYVKHVAASFALAGIEDAHVQAQQVFDLEKKIAATHWDKVKCRDLRLVYNLILSFIQPRINRILGCFLVCWTSCKSEMYPTSRLAMR